MKSKFEQLVVEYWEHDGIKLPISVPFKIDAHSSKKLSHIGWQIGIGSSIIIYYFNDSFLIFLNIQFFLKR